MEFGKSHWRTYERGIEKEWLLTNGMGGFSSSTVIGANARRYHGLLVAALNPPVSRHLILSKIDESITIGGEPFNLYSARTPDAVMEGYLHLQRFLKDPLPTFLYNIGDVFVEKKISMIYGKNTVVVVYRVINGFEPAILRLAPLVNFRDYHHTIKRDYLSFRQEQMEDELVLRPDCMDMDIRIFCSEGTFNKTDHCYFMNMFYPMESERGLDCTDDHYIPGFFEIKLDPREEKVITFLATIEDEIPERDGMVLQAEEVKRLEALTADVRSDFLLVRQLTRAADDFIVHRKSTGAKTIIAGYPWFTDWGRDTMIAFTGLTLATGRYRDARDILYTFSRYVKNGLIPNMFPDVGQQPAYNTVDAALWYFEAVNKYIQYTGDESFIREDLYPVLKEIIKGYSEGTSFDIRMDSDGLISAGNENIQLTWMDAKVGDWVVTPRHGKAVEINALWYNALKIMTDLALKFGDGAEGYETLAEKVRQSFIGLFWNPSGEYLYDVVTNGSKDRKIRPNQILAASLSYPVLPREMAKKVVEMVEKELYTAYGLRSLSPRDSGYMGVYTGDQFHRDSAYHQGTVWTWPLGQFITAFIKTSGSTRENGEKALRFIEPFGDHLRDAGLGSISEIFEGNEPNLPKGCFAQAWSVGEVLRALVEDVLPALGSR